MYSANPKPVWIEGSFVVGNNGTIPGPNTLPTTGISGNIVTSSTAIIGAGIAGVVKVATGQYQIKLNDNYNRLLDFQSFILSPTSGAGPVTDGSLTIGTAYQIVWPSTSTNWVTLGFPSNVTPVYGAPFVATSGASNGPLGSSGVTAPGNGTVIPIKTSGVYAVEVLPNPNLELGPVGTNQAVAGAIVNIQTLGSSNTPVSPTSGTVIRFNMTLRNSSLLLNNETLSNY